MTTRLNFGCGSILPDDWTNADAVATNGEWRLVVRKPSLPWLPMHQNVGVDIRVGLPWGNESFDYAVAHHSLQELTWHELPGALAELHRVLKPGGVLRITVPHLRRAYTAWQLRDRGWFPQDERSGDVDEAFSTFLTWFGTVRTIFTEPYLGKLLRDTGFKVWGAGPGLTVCDDPEIMSLDGDEARVRTQLTMEGEK